MPKVSVIIPVYNASDFLSDRLSEVVTQTLQDIEIICINDGSTDNSLEILQEFAQKDNRIIVINKENSGAGESRNKGIDVATGEYLKFLDADDTMPKEALETLYNIAKEKDLDILFYQKNNLGNQGSLVTRFPVFDDIFNFKEKPELAFKYKASIHNKFYKASFIKENKLYFDNTRTCNDVFFAFYSTFLAQKCYSIQNVLYTYNNNQKKNLSSTRCNYTFNLVKTMDHLKGKLEEIGLFKLYKKSFLKTLRSYINYELGFCDVKSITKFLSEVYNSKSTLKNYIFKFTLNHLISLIFKQIFQITNFNQEYKVLTILGIKIKLKRKKRNK